MTDQSWSWSTASEDTTIEPSGDVHYLDDKRTCVMPVQLKPRRTYAVWLNTEKFQNFQDTKNRPAIPYLLIFETR
jgi:hypothetical protein